MLTTACLCVWLRSDRDDHHVSGVVHHFGLRWLNGDRLQEVNISGIVCVCLLRGDIGSLLFSVHVRLGLSRSGASSEEVCLLSSSYCACRALGLCPPLTAARSVCVVCGVSRAFGVGGVGCGVWCRRWRTRVLPWWSARQMESKRTTHGSSPADPMTRMGGFAGKQAWRAADKRSSIVSRFLTCLVLFFSWISVAFINRGELLMNGT